MAKLPGTSQQLLLASSILPEILGYRDSTFPHHAPFPGESEPGRDTRGPLGALPHVGCTCVLRHIPSPGQTRSRKADCPCCVAITWESRSVTDSSGPKGRGQEPGCSEPPRGPHAPQCRQAPSQPARRPCLSLPSSLHPSYSEKTSSPRDQNEPSLLINPS